jgi:hypothetical protein
LAAVGQRAVVILGLEGVQLQQDLAVAHDLLVRLASVTAIGVEDAGVEAARRGDVADNDEGLRPQLRGHSATLAGHGFGH